MADKFFQERFPKGPLLAAGLLISFALAAASTARLGDVGTVELAAAEPVLVRELRFEDRTDGGIDVIELPGEQLLTVIQPETNGFVRGVLRGMARHRHLENMSDQPPFVLTGWSDGTMSLEDPLTGRKVPLDAFGPTNAEAFARLLTAHGETT
ncbi:MAG: photosynthetic complex assembly protein PuhC [Pseudomonadota bacterium]